MKYYQTFYNCADTKEITHARALDICLGCWRNNDMTRDMLTIPNRIQTLYSLIEVVGEAGERAEPTAFNLVPPDMRYDIEGERI